jgi:hypothetical protein
MAQFYRRPFWAAFFMEKTKGSVAKILFARSTA